MARYAKGQYGLAARERKERKKTNHRLIRLRKAFLRRPLFLELWRTRRRGRAGNWRAGWGRQKWTPVDGVDLVD